MKKFGIYCLKSVGVIGGSFLIISSVFYDNQARVDLAPLINPNRGYVMALLTVGGPAFAFPLWLSSWLINKRSLHVSWGVSGYWALGSLFVSYLGSVLAKKLFDGRNPILRTKDWILFSFVLLPLVLTVSFFIGIIPLHSPFGGSVLWMENALKWTPSAGLGYLLMYPLFMGLFTMPLKQIDRKVLLRDLFIVAVVGLGMVFVFFVDLTSLALDFNSNRYLALLFLIAAGIFASPAGMLLSILLMVYLLTLNRLGLFGHDSLLKDMPASNLQIYLLIVGFFVPWVSSLLREKNDSGRIKKSYAQVRRALEPSEGDGELNRLGVYSDQISVALFDREYRCLELNQRMADFYGFPMKEAVGKSVTERLGENAKVVLPVFQEVLKTKKPIWNLKVRFNFEKDGRTDFQNVLVSYIPVLSKGGNVVAVIATATELGPREQGDDNTDDIVLPIAISHDLQEPLRNVSHALKILKEKFKSEGDAVNSNFVEGALESASRMKGMLRSSIDHYRLHQSDLKIEEFEGSDLMTECLTQLESQLKGSRAQVVCDPIPRLKADKIQLVRVFQNLFSNSIKYRNRERQLIIKISNQVLYGKIQFTFSDNGVGFDSKDSRNIFNLFHRLHSFDEIQGDGVGLTISKKIIELHGGQMWAESKLGEGASFYFTIPVS